MYGLVLQGKGSAWFDGLTLEPVDTSVAATGGLDPFTEDYAGHYAEAAKRFPDLIARRPASFTPRLFNFLALHRSGQMDDARTYIASVADGLADRKWAAPVALFYAGRLSEDEVLKAAASTDSAIARQQKCEAYLLPCDGPPAEAAQQRAWRRSGKCRQGAGVSREVPGYWGGDDYQCRAAQAELARLEK